MWQYTLLHLYIATALAFHEALTVRWTRPWANTKSAFSGIHTDVAPAYEVFDIVVHRPDWRSNSIEDVSLVARTPSPPQEP